MPGLASRVRGCCSSFFFQLIPSFPFHVAPPLRPSLRAVTFLLSHLCFDGALFVARLGTAGPLCSGGGAGSAAREQHGRSYHVRAARLHQPAPAGPSPATLCFPLRGPRSHRGSCRPPSLPSFTTPLVAVSWKVHLISSGALVLVDAPSPRGLALPRRLPDSRQTDANLAALHELGGVAAVAEALGSDPSQGLPDDPAALEVRREAFGANAMPTPTPKSWLELFVATFEDTTVLILCASAAVSLAVGIYNDPNKVGPPRSRCVFCPDPGHSPRSSAMQTCKHAVRCHDAMMP